MAVAREGRTITMTADGDAIDAGNVFFVNGVTFQGATLTAGQRLRLTDATGDVICDYLVEAATDNADLWNGRPAQYANGLLLEDGPADGTWVLTIYCE